MPGVRAAAFAGVFASLAACKGGDAPKESTPAPQTDDAPATAVPTTEAGFLAELAPLPDGAQAIEVRYRITQITGTALDGEMTITLAAGGNRREQWSVQAGPPEAALRLSGLSIATADKIWTATEGAPGELSTNHLGALARAYLQLPDDLRVTVIESIHAWHRMLAEQRERDTTSRAEVLGVACLQTRIAAQNICLWEQTGLMLRYEGSAFRIDAVDINRAPKLSPDAFTLPPEATNAVPDPGTEPNYEQVLRDIAAGSYGSVSALLLAPDTLPNLLAPELPVPNQ